MRRSLAPVVAVLSLILLSASASHAALSSNRRRAVVLEAFYALRPAHDGECGIYTYDGKCLSGWNYLANDLSKATYMRSMYGCNSSVWTNYNDYSGCPNYSAPLSFWRDFLTYGFYSAGGNYGNVGRGGQCKYFANLILYRSGAHPSVMPTYQTMWDYQSTSNLGGAKEGDILFTDGVPNITSHTAIVVSVVRNGSGIATSIDVVDSNYVTDRSGVSNREGIAKHNFALPNIQSIYRIWTGSAYYYDPYIP